MQRHSFALYALIIGLATVFGYFGYDKFANPLIWIGWLPPWMDGLLGLSKEVWLKVTAGIEIVLAILIIVPKVKVRQAGAVLMALHLIGVLTQTGFNDIAIRDFGLLMASVGLFFLL